tara:strand:+ start:1376 stop:1885 length:510 start_codon:yes stop_codon:yes gene_type:complete
MTDEAPNSDKSNAGRPTDYKIEFNRQAEKLCLLGSTDKDMADFFDVSESTINLWKQKHPEFSESIKRGKISADANVASRLYKRAIGYEHDEDKIFNNNGEPLIVPTIKHVQPDTTAAIFWLKNRQPKMWRDSQNIDHTTNGKDLETVVNNFNGDAQAASQAYQDIMGGK